MKNDVKIFIINGPAGVGKDTFVEMSRIPFAMKGYNVINIATVDKVKMAAKILGWDGVSKKDDDRQFLSDLKDLSTKYNDGPAQHIYKVVEKTTGKNIIFAHAREPKEIAILNQTLNEKGVYCRTIFVDRPGVTKYENHADANTTKYTYDIVIDNNSSLDYLNNLVNSFVETYG